MYILNAKFINLFLTLLIHYNLKIYFCYILVFIMKLFKIIFQLINKQVFISFLFLILFIEIMSSCSHKEEKINRWVFNLYELPNQPISWEVKNPFLLVVTENDKLVFSDTAYTKFRGGFSRRFDKKSFSLQLDNDTDFGLNSPRKRWILNANYIDKTFLRHVISYDLYRQMNLQNIAPKSQYIEVYHNNDYKGLYVLMERLDEQKLMHELKAVAPVIWKEPSIFKVDSSKVNTDYNQKYPSKKDKNYSYYLDSITRFLTHSSNTAFNAEVFTLFSKSSLIDWYLILLLSNNSDGLLKNYYLYQLEENTPICIALWDYDHSYGRDGDNELNLIEGEINISRNLLFKRILENNTKNFKEESFARWQELRKELLSAENIEILMEKRIAQFCEVLEKNNEIWSTSDTKWYFDTNNFKQEIDLMKQYFEERLPFLDNALKPNNTTQTARLMIN